MKSRNSLLGIESLGQRPPIPCSATIPLFRPPSLISAPIRMQGPHFKENYKTAIIKQKERGRRGGVCPSFLLICYQIKFPLSLFQTAVFIMIFPPHLLSFPTSIRIKNSPPPPLILPSYNPLPKKP